MFLVFTVQKLRQENEARVVLQLYYNPKKMGQPPNQWKRLPRRRCIYPYRVTIYLLLKISSIFFFIMSKISVCFP